MQKNRTIPMIAMLTKIAILVLLLAGLATTASAQTGPGGGRRGPPPQAIQACEGKSANDSCSFTGRNDETLTGICSAPPGVAVLACTPAGGPPERGGR